MPHESRVFWREGLFLRPQHFQQQERFFDALSLNRSRALRPYPWGLSSLTIDESLASLGKFAVSQCAGILPDGTPFSIPGEVSPPPPLDIPEDSADHIVYLTLPVSQPGARWFAYRDKPEPDVRLLVSEEEIHDGSVAADGAEPVEVATPNLRYGIARRDTEGRVCLGLARVREVLNRQITFDQRYIPPLLDIRATAALSGALKNLTGRVELRLNELADRAAETAQGGSEAFASFFVLQALNRWKPVLDHLANLPNIHPERLFESLVGLAGDLSAMTRTDRKVPEFPRYDHENLQQTFAPVLDALIASLSAIFEQSAGQVKLDAIGPGSFKAVIDPARLQTCAFFLAATARVPMEQLRARLPGVVRMGAVHRMREIVGAGLQAGVRIAPVQTPPPQLRIMHDYVYFELDRSSTDWQELTRAAAAGIHIAGDWPDLKIELWWVKRAVQ